MTFEQRVILMKLLSATKIEVLQEFANGLVTTEIAASRGPDVASSPWCKFGYVSRKS
jgi:hypothetical protein